MSYTKGSVTRIRLAGVFVLFALGGCTGEICQGDICEFTLDTQAQDSDVADSIIPVAPSCDLTAGALLVASTESILTVSATDDQPRENLQVTLNGETIQLTGDVTDLSVPLMEGQNTFSLRVDDEDGESCEASISLTADTTPPAMTVDATPMATADETFTFTGRVTDTHFTETLKLNGAPAAAIWAANNFSLDVHLEEGINNFELVALDQVDNASEVQNFAISLDQTAPGVQIITPLDNTRTGKSTLEVAGSVTSDGGPGASLWVDLSLIHGDETPLIQHIRANNSGEFVDTVELPLGQSRIKACVADELGNEGCTGVNVERLDVTICVQITGVSQGWLDVHLCLRKPTRSEHPGRGMRGRAGSVYSPGHGHRDRPGN